MTKVKICGITTPEMAEVCVQSGVDYMGLVFEENSPRCVTTSQAKELVDIARQGGVEPVAVFYHATVEHIEAIVQRTGIGIVQVHSPIPKLCSGLKYIFACTHPGAVPPHCDFVLYDNPRPGSGMLLNHESIVLPAIHRAFLAGGLNQCNVLSVIQQLKPYGVDVSSGVESSRGLKSEAMIREFVSTVKDFNHA